LIEDVHARHDRLDYLFNNAGIGVGGNLEDLTMAHWERIIDVNLRGVVHGVMAAYPLMIRQGRGHIVNTASMAGLVPTGMPPPCSPERVARAVLRGIERNDPVVVVPWWIKPGWALMRLSPRLLLRMAAAEIASVRRESGVG